MSSMILFAALPVTTTAFVTPLQQGRSFRFSRSSSSFSFPVATTRNVYYYSSPFTLLSSSNTLESASAAVTNSTSSSSSSSTVVVAAEPLAGTWECNEEAECVAVPECTDEECRTSLDVRIHGEWYDLTGTYYVVYNIIIISTRVCV